VIYQVIPYHLSAHLFVSLRIKILMDQSGCPYAAAKWLNLQTIAQ